MQTALPHPAGLARQLAPFILFSLLLHIAILFGVRLQPKNFSIARSHPMEVNLSFHPGTEQAPSPGTAPIGQSANPAKLLAYPKTQTDNLVVQPDKISPTRTDEIFNSQQLMESAKSIAQDEARKTEQQIAALKREKLNSPIGSLEQELRQPYKEIHLSNGMLKIVTDAGAVCFQPVPYFARDAAGLFGIPTTCPSKGSSGKDERRAEY